MLICAVYDKKAMCFFPPFTVENRVMAIRGFEETVNAPGNVISRYPDDFALYTLGEFNEKQGNIVQYELKSLECEARQCVMPKEWKNFNSSMDEGTRLAGEGGEVK